MLRQEIYKEERLLVDKEMLYRCVDCGKELIAKRYSNQFERVCNKCGGHMKPIRIAVSKKPISNIKIGIELEGYDKAKQQLRNLEATFDRILEKQEKIKPISNHRGFKSMQIIDDDGKIREIEIDPQPSHISFDIDELTNELAFNMKDIVKLSNEVAKQLGKCMKKNCGY